MPEKRFTFTEESLISYAHTLEQNIFQSDLDTVLTELIISVPIDLWVHILTQTMKEVAAKHRYPPVFLLELGTELIQTGVDLYTAQPSSP